MAEEDKIGKPWNDDELNAIVADYFSMLKAELSRQPYVKSHHSAVLMQQIGRTHRSVEFKHQNISAVLEEMGLPWILGYKPKRNYQASIFGAIDRYLSSHEDVVYHQLPPKVLAGADDGATFVDAPSLEFQPNRPWQLEQLVRKFDPVERDLRNRTLGRAGEQFVLDIERKKLEKFQRPDLSKKVRWISAEEGDGAGYDILSFEPDGRERLIEVKTTNGAARTPFFISENECQRAAASAESWRLYRVHLFAQTPRIFQIAPPLNKVLHLRPDIWRASFS
jgi:Protein NO VEIN, C-terminal